MNAGQLLNDFEHFSKSTLDAFHKKTRDNDDIFLEENIKKIKNLIDNGQYSICSGPIERYSGYLDNFIDKYKISSEKFIPLIGAARELAESLEKIIENEPNFSKIDLKFSQEHINLYKSAIAQKVQETNSELKEVEPDLSF